MTQTTSPRTLFAKLWDDHLIQAESDATPAVLYVDLHLVHEVTSPQAFSDAARSWRERAAARSHTRDDGSLDANDPAWHRWSRSDA